MPDGQLAEVRYRDTGVLIAAALEGQGVALVRRLLAADDLAAGRLVRIGELLLPSERALFFVCRQGDQDKPAIRTLLIWLRGAL